MAAHHRIPSQPKAGTAAYFRMRREQAQDARNNYDGDDPFYHRRFVAAGKELREMMELPALDWPGSKWAKEAGNE